MANNDLIYRACYEAIANGETDPDDVIEDVRDAIESCLHAAQEQGVRMDPASALGVAIAAALDEAKGLVRDLEAWRS